MTLHDVMHIEEFNMPVIVLSAKVRNPNIPHFAQSSAASKDKEQYVRIRIVS